MVRTWLSGARRQSKRSLASHISSHDLRASDVLMLILQRVYSLCCRR
jgi:hypothetical protein